MRRYQRGLAVRSRVARGFTMVELLVVIAIIAVLVSLLLPALSATREAARSTECKNNLKQLALAIGNFHDRNSQLPTFDGPYPPEGVQKITAGWFVHILPDLDRQVLYDKIMNRKQGEPGVIVEGTRPGPMIIEPASDDWKPAYCVYLGIGEDNVQYSNDAAVQARFWKTDGYIWRTECTYGNSTAEWEANGCHQEWTLEADDKSPKDGVRDCSVWKEPRTGADPRTCDSSGNRGVWNYVPRYWVPGGEIVVTQPKPGQEFRGGGIGGEPGVSYDVPGHYAGPTDTFSLWDWNDWVCGGPNECRNVCRKNNVIQDGKNGTRNITDASNCGEWYKNGRKQCYPEQGTPARQIQTTIGGVKTVQPRGVNIGFEELTCWSDPSPTRALQTVWSNALAQSTGQAFWALTNYQANFWVFSAQRKDLSGSTVMNDEWTRYQYVDDSEKVPRKLETVTDGLSNTILLSEGYRECGITRRFAFWSRWMWQQFDLDTMQKADFHSFGSMPQEHPTIPDKYIAKMHTAMFQSYPNNQYCGPFYVQAVHGSALNVAMCDGSVKAIASTIAHEQLNDHDRPGMGEFPDFDGPHAAWDCLMMATDHVPIREKF